MKLLFNKEDFDKVWFMSDPHYSHTNICRGVSKWPGGKGTRDFDTLEEMNAALVKGINDNVKKDDILINLGDWSFGGIDKIFEFRDLIICDYIFTLIGNHDHHIENDLPITHDGHKRRPSHLFEAIADVFDITFKTDKKPINVFCSHYAHLVWNKSHHGRIHLFGHSHATINDQAKGKSMDVGVDNAFLLKGEYRPLHLKTEILPMMEKLKPEFIDHHNANTTE